MYMYAASVIFLNNMYALNTKLLYDNCMTPTLERLTCLQNIHFNVKHMTANRLDFYMFYGQPNLL